MANVNYDFQKCERERAKQEKKAAKARDNVTSAAHPEPEAEPSSTAVGNLTEVES